VPADVLEPGPAVALTPGASSSVCPAESPRPDGVREEDTVELVVRRLHRARDARLGANDSADSAWAILSPAERIRAGAMLRPDDAARFVVGRAAVREAVGRRIGVPPAGVALTLVDGRPFVRDRPDLSVSISHRADAVVVATAFGRRVGVDIESVDPSLGSLEMIGIARDLLGTSDVPDPAATSRERIAAWFLARWTLTEAVLKALGTGFRADPRLVQLRLEPSRDPRGGQDTLRASLLSAPGTDVVAARGWSLHPFRICPAMVGALAVDRPGVVVHGAEIEPL